MKPKKGDLINTVVWVIVALLCIVLLWKLAAAVIGNLGTSDYKNAQKAIDIIEMKINAINSWESTRFAIQSPCIGRASGCEWMIFGFSKDEVGDRKPDRCYFDSCICICKNIGSASVYDKVIDERVYGANGICQRKDTGICRKLNVKEAKAVSVLNENSAGVPFITLKKPLVELTVKKGGDSAEIFAGYVSSESDETDLRSIEARSQSI